MRALDCSDPSTHSQDMHFTAEDDEQLFTKIKKHASEYHPQMTDEGIRDVIVSNAYDA
jgi:hypothetical protein